MKQSVSISTYSFIMSTIGMLILAGLFFYLLRNGHPWQTYMIYGIITLLFFGVLIYMPRSITVNDKELCVNRSLWVKTIPLSEIKSIELMQPTMGAKTIFASGGWLGYWGWFSEKDLGKYFAYYGKSSDCFFVRLNNGRQYMLGCNNPKSVIDFISTKIPSH